MSARVLLLVVSLSLVAGCATTRGSAEHVASYTLSDDPAILLAEARAYQLAGYWDEAALRFDKLVAGLEHPADEGLFLTASLFLNRSQAGRLQAERDAAELLLRAWEELPDAAIDPRFDEVERLVQRASLVRSAAAAESDPEASAGPSNALLVHGRSDEDFFLSRTRCGADLAGVWRRSERVAVDLYREQYDKVTATCDGAEGTREFWVDTSVWTALVAASEGAEPPSGFTREEAVLLVSMERPAIPVKGFAAD